jgi:hypothetical protein
MLKKTLAHNLLNIYIYNMKQVVKKVISKKPIHSGKFVVIKKSNKLSSKTIATTIRSLSGTLKTLYEYDKKQENNLPNNKLGH